MDIVQLKYVAELARECNFSHAAENLYITQPALSQQIRRLEQEIGFSLFTRNTKNVSLTPAGKEFVEYAVLIIDEFTKLEEFSRRIARDFAQTITFGTSSNSSKLISSAIPEFIAQYPNVHLSYTEDWDNKLLEMLRENRLDIAMVLTPLKADVPGIRLFPVFSDCVCALLNPKDPLADQEQIRVDDLSNRKLIFTSPNSVIKQMLTSMLHDYGNLEEHTLNIADKDARRPMMKKGAICFSLYKRQLNGKQNEFRAIPIEPRLEMMFCFAVSDKEKMTAAKQAFIKIGGDVLCKSLENGV